jgi:quinol monooxygenase YgiN
MEKTMRRTLIRYKAKPESADKNAELIAAVFAELRDAKPAGLRYLLRLEDDSFIHFVMTEADDGSSALRELPAFQAFQSGIRDRCDELPLVRLARIVGNYRMLETE